MLARGTVVAGYRIDGVLGAGGMGVVYEATQLSLDRTVALKLLAHGVSDDASFRRRFRREGRIQGRLDHPHIVSVHEAGEAEEGLFIAMRLVRGPTLKDMIVARELDAGRTLRLLRPIAEALDVAHEAGLTHRDVKPQNILVGGRDHPYLADFGLTQDTGGSHVTGTGQFVGTFDYVAPEQIQGDEPAPPVDIYSLAGVLYECLTGQVPFTRRSQAAVIYAHLASEPPRVSDQRPELPTGLDAVVSAGMAKDPSARPDSATALIAAAEHAFDRRSRAVLHPPGPVESPEEIGVRAPERAVSTAEALRPPQGPGDTHSTAAMALPATLRPRRASPGLGRRGAWLAVAGAALAALVAGALLAGAGGDGGGDSESGRNSASLGPIEIRYGSGLARDDSGPRIPGMPSGALRLATAGGAGIATAMTEATGGTLLPEALRRSVVGDLPRPAAVRAGEASALRYAGVRARGVTQPLTLYVAPTTAGVATIACYGPSAFAQRCSDVAESLQLHGPRPLPLGPSPDYAAALNRIVRALGGRRALLRAQLAEAGTPRAQAAAAAALVIAYRDARRALGGLDVSPAVADTHEAIGGALASAAAAYTRLAAAARDADRRDYARSRGAVSRSERRLNRALRRLTRAGYGVG